ncbi:MAG TPA: YciI family protein, partial [Micromonosporaceae bacterium]|nr:YciI family protein [Micromonosporaceae bacterium]
YAETKEQMGGFWIIEAADLDVALRIAAEASRHCNRRLELRPFL